MGKSNLGDTGILNDTVKTTNERGYAQLGYTLPSGRKVVSEWIDPNQLKGQVFIQWCNVVREQDEFDIGEREAKEEQAIAQKRERVRSSPAPSTEHVPVRSASSPSSAPGLVEQYVETSQASSLPSRTISDVPRQSPPALPDDPTDLVSSKLRALRIQLAEVQDQLSELSLQEQSLGRAIKRWETVEASLQGPSAVQQSTQSERQLLVPEGRAQSLVEKGEWDRW